MNNRGDSQYLRISQSPWLALAVAALMVIFFWHSVFGIEKIFPHADPISYHGDVLQVAANMQAYAVDDLPLIGPKHVARLGAPFGANWNDWPITEDILFWAGGQLAKVIGIFAAINTLYLFAAVLSALSFVLAAHRMGIANWASSALGVAFALPSFYWLRGPGHMVLMFYWTIPLLACILHSIYKADLGDRWKDALLVGGLGVAFGIQNPYYSWMSCLLVGASSIVMLLRKRWVASGVLMTFIIAAGAGFFAVNYDTLSYTHHHGANPGSVTRVFAHLDFYALRIPGLLVPPLTHKFDIVNQLANAHWYSRGLAIGEAGSSYLGLVGIVGFLLLLILPLVGYAKDSERIDFRFWHVAWVLFYALAGGVGLVLGVAGIIIFRGANRFSIFVLCYSLLFLGTTLSKLKSTFGRVVVFLVLLMVVFFDQLPVSAQPHFWAETSARVESDRKFAHTLEQKYGDRPLFTFPVVVYPEYGAVEGMSDYEHFRLYINSHILSISYGSNKGRPDTAWQFEAQSRGPDGLCRFLAAKEFAAVIVNVQGLGAKKEAIIREFSLLCGDPLQSDLGDLLAFDLQNIQPLRAQDLLSFKLGDGFYGWEGREADGQSQWSWGREENELLVENSSATEIIATVKIRIGVLSPREVSIEHQEGKVSRHIDGTEEFELSKLRFPRGTSTLKISSSLPAIRPNNGDPRSLALRIDKPAIAE